MSLFQRSLPLTKCQYIRILDEFLDGRITENRNLKAANWMLYQIALHSRVQDELPGAKTLEETDRVIEWWEQCEDDIQARRQSEPFPTILDIVFAEKSASLCIK